jgi:hypothetical protein
VHDKGGRPFSGQPQWRVETLEQSRNEQERREWPPPWKWQAHVPHSRPADRGRKCDESELDGPCKKENREPRSTESYDQVEPSPPIKRAKKAATELNKPPFNIERYLPWDETTKMGRASLAMAYLTLRSTVVRLSPLLCYEDRDPLFLVSFLCRTPTYSILTCSSIRSAHAETPPVRGARTLLFVL